MTPAAVLARAGLPDTPTTRLSGGSISDVHRAGAWVVKCHPRAPAGLFEAEARGLRALSDAGVRVPAVRWAGPEGIVMRHLPPGPDDPVGLAEQIARLHATPADDYGWPDPIFLGSFPLPRSPASTDWPDFWARHRIDPLLAATRTTLGAMAPAVERLLADFDPPVEGPCLVHGDLWSGNVLMSAAGPALIDPSVWRGERSVDLAMMHLFGGFGPRFWDAYRALRPIPRAVAEAIPFHQLYFVLVHVHLFGAGYLGHVRRILDRSA